MMINETNKKSFKEMMKGRAVYLALAACVLAAGLISYTSAGKNNLSARPDTVTVKQPETSTWVHVDDRAVPELTTAAPVTLAPPETTLPPQTQAQPVFDNAAEPLETTTAAPKQLTFSLPVNAKMGKDFSMGVPVFSETMNDYRTHNGVDFLAAAGTPVHPIAEGKVISVTTDALFGVTVTVDHGNGLVSSISGLANEGLIHEGADVYNETALGVVGALPVESADGSHIHLEVRSNGVLQDPLAVMGWAEPDAEE